MNKWCTWVPRSKNINLEVKKARKSLSVGLLAQENRLWFAVSIDRKSIKRDTSLCLANELTEDLKNIEAVRRDVGMCFQHFNLFPHLTVLENCTLAPASGWKRCRKKKPKRRRMKKYQSVKYPHKQRCSRVGLRGQSNSACSDCSFSLCGEPTSHAVFWWTNISARPRKWFVKFCTLWLNPAGWRHDHAFV